MIVPLTSVVELSVSADISADLETEAESEVSISAAQEATLLELSPEHDTPAAQAHQNPVDQSFQSREPPRVHSIALHPMAESTPAAATILATPWRAGLQEEIRHVRHKMSQTISVGSIVLHRFVGRKCGQ